MKQLLAVVFIATTLFACTKDAATTNGGSTTNGGNTFTWVDNSITYNCDSAYASTQYKTIFVFKGATTTKYFFEINLTSLAVANYSFTTQGNTLSYIRPSNTALLTSFAGSLGITTNANNKITGVGVATVNSSTTGERINFSFTDLPVR
ncbi:MAG: hypothetical protein H7068_01115 [Pedobacter sp.]|nr:hypothetical protein [Chitinophagaceae bacterium]